MCVCDVLAGVTQEEGHIGFLHISSAVLALICLVGVCVCVYLLNCT